MNYYLTKANPNKWRLQDFLRSPDEDFSGWWSDVCKDAKPGDTLFIGLSGKDAGIFARGTLKSCPKLATLDPEFCISPEDAKERLGADIEISYLEKHLGRHILEHDIRKIPELNRIARWLHVQGGCCQLTKEEAEALNKLIEASKRKMGLTAL